MKSTRIYVEMLILTALIVAGCFIGYTLGTSHGKTMASRITESGN